jgi:hypothetical protein
MTKQRFSLLLGIIGQAGCIVYDEPLRRPRNDLLREGGDDAAQTPPGDAASDVSATDARDAANDAAPASDVSPDRDEHDVTEDDDVRAPDAGHDAARDGRGDIESGRDVTADGIADADDAFDAPRDGPPDRVTLGCTVELTVTGVAWDVVDGPHDARREEDAGREGGARGVKIVGDLPALGMWDPAMALSLVEKGPGTWSVVVVLSDGLPLQFKFVKLDPAHAPEWESWEPFDSNRSMRIDCAIDGGSRFPDAADGAGPAIGRRYIGVFGSRPLDATK